MTSSRHLSADVRQFGATAIVLWKKGWRDPATGRDEQSLGTDMLVYASVSRGFKSEDTPVNPATITTQNVPAKQEELTAYEIGTKAKLFANRVQLNASFFYYDYRNKQVLGNYTDPIYTVLTQLQNIPKSEAYGVDADLTWRIAAPITAVLSGRYLHTAITSFPGAIGDSGQPVNLDGDPFAYAPTFSGAATLLLDQPISRSAAG